MQAARVVGVRSQTTNQEGFNTHFVKRSPLIVTGMENMYIDERMLDEIEGGSSYCFHVYEQQHPEVVLGRSRDEEKDVHIERVRMDRVPVLRRIGGGGTVLLAPGVIVISVAGKSSLPFHLREHMNAVNLAVIRSLQALGVRDLSIRGISDIAIGDSKILGSSLYRRKDTVLYQGSLLLNPDLSLVEYYLKHPEMEPDYRRGRSHREFLTSLWKEGYRIPKAGVVQALNETFLQGAPWETRHGFSPHLS